MSHRRPCLNTVSKKLFKVALAGASRLLRWFLDFLTNRPRNSVTPNFASFDSWASRNSPAQLSRTLQTGATRPRRRPCWRRVMKALMGAGGESASKSAGRSTSFLVPLSRTCWKIARALSSLNLRRSFPRETPLRILYKKFLVPPEHRCGSKLKSL